MFLFKLCSASKKVSFAVIQTLGVFVFLAMLFFLKIIIFLSTHLSTYIWIFSPSHIFWVWIYKQAQTRECLLSKKQAANRPLPPLDPDPPALLLRRSTRICHPPTRFGFSNIALLFTLASFSIPNSYSQAKKDDCWQQAMKKLDALNTNHTRDTISCPDGIKPIGCKWV